LRHWPPGTNNKPFVPSFFSVPPFPPESAQVPFLQEGCARFPGRAAGSSQSPSTPLRRAAMRMGSKSPDNARPLSIGPAGGLHASIVWKVRSGQIPGVYRGFQLDAAAVCGRICFSRPENCRKRIRGRIDQQHEPVSPACARCGPPGSSPNGQYSGGVTVSTGSIAAWESCRGVGTRNRLQKQSCQR
jgi:hypothetical protein